MLKRRQGAYKRMLSKQRSYLTQLKNLPIFPKWWDMVIFCILFAIIVVLGWGAQAMGSPYIIGEALPISLDPSHLPEYAVRTMLRMLCALVASLIFTITVGCLAAKSPRAERFIMPFIDIMQSIPVLGFLSLAVFVFIPLFPGSLLGPECAAIFAIFTSQVWNMTISFYQSLRTVPSDLSEVASILHLSAWQKFWKIEVPFATPSLFWNTMMSMSAGWFYVVASEAITVFNKDIHLPGIGSYIDAAVLHGDIPAIFYAMFTMFIVILLCDQLLFRPIAAWIDKFHSEIQDQENSSWFLNWLQRAQISAWIVERFVGFKEYWLNPGYRLPSAWPGPSAAFTRPLRIALSWGYIAFWNIGMSIAAIASFVILTHFVATQLSFNEISHVFYLGAITGLKVLCSTLLSALIWVPIGVWISFRPRFAQVAQSMAQFFASFPANLLFPLVFAIIIRYHLNVDLWTIPLMMLGTQWYILFNVIAGINALQRDAYLAVKQLQVKGWLWWKRFILPALFPYIVTGAMTATGAAWNASIVAEVIQSGGITLTATGLGAYITEHTMTGDFPRITLGIAVICLYVIVTNRLIWRKLYALAETRYKWDSL